MPKKAIFDKKNILVIGGAGFIGSHLCDELVRDNKVICIDNFLTGQESNISHLYQDYNFKFLNHDIVNAIDLEQERTLESYKVEFQGIQEIYFLASPTSPTAYGERPIETLLINSLGLRNALDMAVKYKAKILFASSPVVYGDGDNNKTIKEDVVGRANHLGPRACFAEAQRFGESLVDSYRQIYDLDAKIVRIFNCYGSRMSLDDGRMIPEMIRAALSGEPLTIYGDKKSVGTYFYVTDLIKALMKMMDSGEQAPINLGSEWQNSFTEIADKIIKLTGSESTVEYQPKTELMADQLLPDISLAKEKLGWFPVMLLDEGLREIVDYLSAQKDILVPGSRG